MVRRPKKAQRQPLSTKCLSEQKEAYLWSFSDYEDLILPSLACRSQPKSREKNVGRVGWYVLTLYSTCTEYCTWNVCYSRRPSKQLPYVQNVLPKNK